MYKKRKENRFENEQIVDLNTFSNPSVFQWPPYIKVIIVTEK